VETGLRIRQLAADIGLSRLYVVGNKVRDPEDRELIVRSMAGLPVLACLAESSALRQAARRGVPAQDPDLSAAIRTILDTIETGA
jgi:CO dehydrogenase maturation factor